MIYNAIKNSPVPVDCYVDGLAASMAAIVLTAADKAYMAENAFLLFHAPASATNGRGTAEEHLQAANALAEMEKLFVKTLVSRTGKPEEQVKKWLQGDNWFSAEQALKEGLIDGITNPVARNIHTLTPAEAKASTPREVYDIYSAYLTNNQNDKNDMNKKEVIEAYTLAGVTENSTEAEIIAAMEKKLKDEQTARKTAEDRLKEQQAAAITAALDEVKGRITPEQRAQYQAIGEKVGIEALRVALQPYRQKPTITDMLHGAVSAGGSGSVRPDKNNWTFDDWQAKDPRGLEALAQVDYEAFNALYNAKYGTNAPK